MKNQKKTDNTRRLTRTNYQRGLRRELRDHTLTKDIYEIERLELFLLALALLLDLITSGLAVINMVVNLDTSSFYYFLVCVATYYFIQFATSVFERDLIANHQKLGTEKVQIEYIINLLKSIKDIFK